MAKSRDPGLNNKLFSWLQIFFRFWAKGCHFSGWRCAWVVLWYARSAWVSFKRTFFKFARSGKTLQDMKYPDASLDDRLSWVFTWSYWAVSWRDWTIFLVSGNKLPFYELRLWAEAAKKTKLSRDLDRKILGWCGFYLTASILYHSHSHENQLTILFLPQYEFYWDCQFCSGKLKPICF